VHKEQLNGNNQYKCEKCNNQYQDAEKYCQLKTLPPILTLSLQRFTYDLRSYQRIKETGRFEFPLELDLAEFMEDSIRLATSTKVNTVYELYSVIIHSGSAYGGHYHTFIRDMDQLGHWTLAEDFRKHREQELNKSSVHKESNLNEITNPNPSPTGEFDTPMQEICLICNDDAADQSSISKNGNESLVNLDFIKYEHPLELLKAYIYNTYKYGEVRIGSICADLTKTTGTSWNKRFKSKYGTIEKFLRKNELTFNVGDGVVNLKPHDRINIVSSRMYGVDGESSELIGSCLKEVDDGKTFKFKI
jgi:ubiquitin carboxyl-terminal hydrolase 40